MTAYGMGGMPHIEPEPTTRWTAPEESGWVGWIVFGGVTLIMVGIFKAIWGLVALFDEGFYAIGPEGLVVSMDYNAWGWTMLIFGAVLVIVGAALFTGRTWARVLAIVLAALSAVANFLTIGAYPFWSLIMITLDVFVIYAIAVHGREMRAVRQVPA